MYAAAPGSLEHFLTERYCLYAVGPDGGVSRTEVHHRPWPLQRAEAEIWENTMTAAGGVPVSGPPALLHFARRIDVVVWGAEKMWTPKTSEVSPTPTAPPPSPRT